MGCEKRKGEEVGYKDRSVNSCFFFINRAPGWWEGWKVSIGIGR